MATTFDKLIGAGIIGAFVLMIYKSIRTDVVINKLDVATDRLSENMEVSIEDAVVRSAVEKAVDRAAKVQVQACTADIVRYRKNEIDAQVSDAVKSCLSDIASDVKKEASNKVAMLDLREIKKEVLEDLREEAEKKLKDDMDDILDEYKSHLRNIDSVYESVAEALSGRDKKETVLRLG